MVTVDIPTMTGAPWRQKKLHAECNQIYSKIHRRKNAKQPDEVWQAYLKKVFRKPVETCISQIENLFPRKVHAVTAEGFLLKVFLFVLAYTFDGLLEE